MGLNMYEVSSLGFDVGGSKPFDIVFTIQIDINEVSLPKIVHSVLHEVVLSQAFLKIDSLFVLEVKIDSSVDFQFLFAETYSSSHSVSKSSFLVNGSMVGLCLTDSLLLQSLHFQNK
jgi:hypothetical protein